MVMKVRCQQAGKRPGNLPGAPVRDFEPYLNSDIVLNLNQVWTTVTSPSGRCPGWRSFVPPPTATSTFVPIGIQKDNVIFYNIQVFEKYGVEIPDHQDSRDEFWALCEEAAAKCPTASTPSTSATARAGRLSGV